MRTLVLDIETSPNVADVWSLWNVNVGLNQLHESSRTICFAAKWTDRNKVMYHSVFHDDYESMVTVAHNLLDEADAVVGWNSTPFDLKTLNNEFVRMGFAPPSSYKSIDLIKTVKKNFRFPSNKLDYVATELGVGSKLSTGGHDLWRKCLEFDPKAWQKMRKYNCQDVLVTEGLYFKLLPWISDHPNVALYDQQEEQSCPTCGSTSLTKRGFYTAETGRYQRFNCTMCGKWSRSTVRAVSVQTRGI